MLLQNGGKADPGSLRKLRRHQGVEEVRRAKSELRAEQPEIVVGIVEHFFNGGIGEKIAQSW